MVKSNTNQGKEMNALLHAACESAHARPACFIIKAATGHVRAARGLVSRAIRSVVHQDAGNYPHCMTYYSLEELRQLGHGDIYPRYVVNVTDAQFDDICNVITASALAEGWDGPPMDAYHD
jgi:hypothetical protein